MSNNEQEKDIWQAFEEVREQHPDAFKGKPPVVDLEYAYKLARTLRWRTWPEEKPKTKQVVVNRWHLGEYIIMAGTYSRETLRNDLGGFICDFEDGDQWMYLSDLEVVR